MAFSFPRWIEDLVSPWRRSTRAVESIAPHRSAHVGINDYPGGNQDLAGCLNDASDWESYFCSRGFSDRMLVTNAAATASKIVEMMEWVVDGLRPGQTSVFTYSGHGCQVPDADGDERDGLDEALCAHDFTWDDPARLSDDVVFGTLSRAPEGACVVVVADCCHSGTLQRGGVTDLVARRLTRHGTTNLFATGVKKNRLATRAALADNGLVVLSACLPTEVAYDTSRRGRPCGAFTSVALDSLRENGYGLTYRQLIDSSTKKLSEPQHPQLGGPAWAEKTQVFSPGRR